MQGNVLGERLDMENIGGKVIVCQSACAHSATSLKIYFRKKKIQIKIVTRVVDRIFVAFRQI